MTALAVLVAIGLGTYGLRAAMLATVASRPLPAGVQSALGLVVPAAIAALVATFSLTHGGAVQVLPLPELAAVVAGFVAVRRTGNVMHAFTAGLPTMWLLAALVG